MSVRVIDTVLRNSRSRLAARLVMLVIADGAHDDGIFYDGNDLIARKARISLSEVKKSLADLEAIGEIEKRRAKRGRARFNVYRVTLPGVEEPVYRKIPFEVDPPFTTTAPMEPWSENDYGSSGASTTALLEPTHARDPSRGPVEKDPLGAIAPVGEVGEWPPQVPPVHLDDGRANRPLNALLEECGVDAKSRRVPFVAVCLNGNPKTGEPGIRDLFWIECIRYAEENDQRDRLAELTPAQFANLLAERIHQKAALYRERMPNVEFGPKGFADYWLDLNHRPRQDGRPRAISRDEFIRQFREAQVAVAAPDDV